MCSKDVLKGCQALSETHENACHGKVACTVRHYVILIEVRGM